MNNTNNINPCEQGEQRNNLDFYITQFRAMFRRLFILYGICVLLILFLFYKINNRPVVTYYAASESGVLKPVKAYAESQAQGYMQAKP